MSYSAAWDGRPQRLWTVSVETLETLPTDLPAARLLAISSSGEVAVALGSRMDRFGASGTLPRLAVGPLRGGTPRVFGAGISSAGWSSVDTTLAIVRETQPGAVLEYPPGNVLVRSTTYLSDLRISPDGGRVAFVEHDKDRNSGGVVAVVDRKGRRTSLTPTYFDVNGLAWSPGGSEVWFTAGPMGTPKSVRAVTLSGQEREVHRETGHLVLLDIAADGRALVAREDFRYRVFYRSGDAEPDRELSLFDCSRLWDLTTDGRMISFWEFGEGIGRGGHWTFIRNTRGDPPTRLLTGKGARPVFSPDGRSVAMALGDSGSLEVAVYPTGDGQPKEIVVPGFSDATAGLLPDGAGLWLADVSPERPRRVWVADADGSNARPVTPEGVEARHPWIAPDGRAVVGLSGGEFRLYPIPGGEPVPLKGIRDGEALAGWNADGRSVFAYDPMQLPPALVRVDWATGARTEVGRIGPSDLAGVLSMYVLVTPDGRQAAYMVNEDLRVLYVVEGLR